MQEILDQSIRLSHNRKVFYYSLSSMLERCSYYGLRALIVLYLVSDAFKMESQEALSIFGWFAALILVSKVVGGLIGDLALGNRRSIILGGIIQAAGAFVLCSNNLTSVYIGLAMVVIGSGLYSPNLIATFGKLYLKKTKLLDSAFTLFYLAVNVGSFFGVWLIGMSGELYGYHIGFLISGLIMLLSIILIWLVKDQKQKNTTESTSFTKNYSKIIYSFIFLGLFWGIYHFSSFQLLQLKITFKAMNSFQFPGNFWQAINGFFTYPIAFIAFLIWSRKYSSQFYKLMIGFIFGCLAFLFIYFIPGTPSENHAYLYLIAFLFLAISEIHIAPIINSVLTQYARPKYLAIVISLSFLPIKLFSFLFGLFNESFVENPQLGLTIANALSD